VRLATTLSRSRSGSDFQSSRFTRHSTRESMKR